MATSNTSEAFDTDEYHTQIAWYLDDPHAFVLRRTERLEFFSSTYFRVQAVQELLCPPGRATGSTSTQTLVPALVGYYSKVRMPDLVVRNGAGERLVVFSREERRQYVAVSLVLTAQRQFLDDLNDDLSLGAAAVVWTIVVSTVAEVLDNSPDPARAKLKHGQAQLRKFEEDPKLPLELRKRLRVLLGDDALWASIARLCDVAPIFCWTPADTNTTRLVIESENLEPVITFDTTLRQKLTYHPRNESQADEVGRVRRATALFVQVPLRWLALVPKTVFRDTANLGMAQSLWMIMTPPPGVEAVRAFWLEDHGIADRRAIQAATGGRVVLGNHHKAGPRADSMVAFDVQIRPSASLDLSIGLVLLLLLVAYLVFHRFKIYAQGGDDLNRAVELASGLSAIPAALLGLIAFRSHAFAQELSRGPRYVLAVVASVAAGLATSLGLGRNGGEATELLAFALMVLCATAGAILMVLRHAPRFRLTEFSRIPRTTECLSPLVSRKKQWRWTLLLVVALMTLVAGLAVVKALASRPMPEERDPKTSHSAVDVGRIN